MQNHRIVSQTFWQNAAKIEMAVYDQPLPDQDRSDRLHLMVTDADGSQRGWLMNPQDATALIRVLAAGIDEAISHDWPMRPEDGDA